MEDYALFAAVASDKLRDQLAVALEALRKAQFFDPAVAAEQAVRVNDLVLIIVLIRGLRGFLVFAAIYGDCHFAAVEIKHNVGEYARAAEIFSGKAVRPVVRFVPRSAEIIRLL